MKRTRKQIGSLLLAVCMVFTMMPTVAFAEEGGQDSDIPSSTSKITAFADLENDVSLQEVESGTTEEELNLPSTLTVTVTTGHASIATVSGDDGVTEEQEHESQQEETTLDVSGWTADPVYDGDTAGDYVYTPTLDLSNDTALADGMTLPQITVTVKEPVTPMLRATEIQPLGTDTGTDITDKFTDANFLAEVRTAINKGEGDPIYDTDVVSVTSLSIASKRITSLAGIKYFTGLTFLNCSSNQLTGLDVSNNMALTRLDCSYNQLTVLDVSRNTVLLTLNCFGNQLTGLDMSNNMALTRLNCSENQLTAIDVSNSAALSRMECYKNQLTELDVSNNTALSYLICSINKLTALDVGNNTKLLELGCLGNKLSTLDVSQNTELNNLYCSTNQLTALDVGNNTKLLELGCSGNKLSTLDVSQNTELNKLNCSTNQLTALDVSNNTALSYLNCNNNKLKMLDVSKNKALAMLDCSHNYMSDELAVKGLDTSLTTDFIFDPQNSSPSTYAVTVNTGIANPSTASAGATVTITANTPDDGKRFKEWTVVNGGVTLVNAQASSTTFTMPANVVEITATYENIPDIGNDITANFPDANFLVVVREALKKAADEPIYDNDDFASIKRLDAVNKNIESLEGIEYFTELAVLYCNYNQLTELDVSKNTKLTLLSCTHNQLSKLDVSNNTALTNLYCYDNKLKTLNVSSNTALTTLHCYNNQLTELDVSNNTSLTQLYCFNNQLRTLDVSKNKALAMLDCYYNYMSGEAAVKGLDKSLTTDFTFDPQNSSTSAYTVTVNSGTASSSTAVANATVTITAGSAPSGKRFKEWTVVSGGVTLENLQELSTTFIMPANAVEITANYEDIPAGAPFITQHPQDVTVQEGGTATFTIAADNATRYAWDCGANENDIPHINGRIIDTPDKICGATTATLTIYNVTRAMNGTRIWCYAYGEGNSNEGSNSARLTVTKGGDTMEHAIMVTNGTADKTTTSSGETVTITADAAPSGQRFKEWTVVSGGVTLANLQASSTTFTMPANAVEITATYEDIPGGSSSSGSPSGGSSPTNTATIKKNQPNQPITAVSSVTATVGTNGKASASIPDKAVTDAISKAQAEVTKQKKTENGISIGLNVTMPKGATTLTATLSKNALNSLVSAGVTNLEINGSPVNISFDQKALTEIQKQTSGNVNIAITSQEELSETAKAIIGTRPVYNITVSYGNNSTVSSFGEGGATIAIPYTPANGEVISGLYAVYVDENGYATRVEGSVYDANSGSVLFTTPHFSMYGVGYTAPSEKLIDISNHWAKESIDYVVDKGMIDGATETTFAPDTFMTRGTLVTALGRLTGKDVSSYTTSSFTDVDVESTSQPYIEWAYKEGIIHGIGNDEFAPERAITREEIAVIIANFTNATGYTLPVNGESTAYTDASSIGDYYKTAVTAMQQAGIMTGGTDNKFNPKSNATRAEVSSMLHRYIKLIVD